VGGGLVLQAIGTAVPLAIGYAREKREDVGGQVTLATVRLIWHQMIHDHHDLVWITAGVVVFAIGSVVLARPFCRRRLTLLVAVPVAAVLGIAVLGAIALLLTVLTLVGDLVWDSGGGSSRGRDENENENER
jgi:hypothetical protein